MSNKKRPQSQTPRPTTVQNSNSPPVSIPPENVASELGADFRESLAFSNLVINSIKTSLLGKSSNQLDSLYETFGYRLELRYKDFERAYKRQDIAGRIIDSIVDFTWKDFPIVVDDDEAQEAKAQSGDTIRKLKQMVKSNKLSALRRKKLLAMNNDDQEALKRVNDEMATIESVDVVYTPFEDAVWALQGKFPMLKLMKRADILNCIGRYSIMVIGTNVEVAEGEDKRINDLKEELPKGTNVEEIAYLYTYSEDQVTINQWETNAASPRYGLPKMYNIQVSGDGGVAINHQVHWTRVIHIAEDLLDSEVYGTPKLERVYNDLQDMLKVVGGSAEMFWLGAYQGLVFNVEDGYQLDDASRKAMTQEIENYVNKLQRFIKTKGVEVTTLSSPVADPRGNFEVLVKLISGSSNVPIRILLGAENGQYAGDTDQDTWLTYISSRRNSHADETMIRPLIDRLVDYGYLPMPMGGEYYIKWPALFEQTQTEKLANAKTMVETAKAATPFGNTLDIVTVEEVRTSIGLDAEIPQTKYDQFADEGDALMGEDIDNLPNADDTDDMTSMSALELYRARKNRLK